MKKVKHYKAFISYSWTSSEHEKWVLELANQLVKNGVDAILDKWNLNPGNDKYTFMESMVLDKEIDRVLIICEHGYKTKADNRIGGVGTEVQIITPELYSKVDQNKFIPIIAEKGEHLDSFMPVFLKSRLGIDMSSPEVYEKGFEELLRLIINRPYYTKPSVGKLPEFLLGNDTQTKNN